MWSKRSLFRANVIRDAMDVLHRGMQPCAFGGDEFIHPDHGPVQRAQRMTDTGKTGIDIADGLGVQHFLQAGQQRIDGSDHGFRLVLQWIDLLPHTFGKAQLGIPDERIAFLGKHIARTRLSVAQHA